VFAVFVIIIPDTSANEALTIGERLRKNVKRACNFTISVGVSHSKKLAGHINELINNADKALYKAKRAGKDKVSLYKKNLPPLSSTNGTVQNILPFPQVSCPTESGNSATFPFYSSQKWWFSRLTATGSLVVRCNIISLSLL
jgi:hypothetical protein